MALPMSVLRHYGFGTSILSWLVTLYESPKAKIKYYGFESPLLPIRRGTRQVCPLSPLLFILALEPLAEAVRTHLDIKDIEVVGFHHQISLIADDILMTLPSPRVSLPNLLSLLDTFACLSGLLIPSSLNQCQIISYLLKWPP